MARRSRSRARWSGRAARSPAAPTRRSAWRGAPRSRTATSRRGPRAWRRRPVGAHGLPELNGVTIQNPQTYAGLNLVSHGVACATTNHCTGANPQQGRRARVGSASPLQDDHLNSATGPGTQIDPTLGATASLRWPRYGNQCAIVNQVGNHINVNQLVQTHDDRRRATSIPPTARSTSASWSRPCSRTRATRPTQQPYFFVQLTNVTQANAVLYSNYNFSNQAGVPWKTVNTGGRHDVPVHGLAARRRRARAAPPSTWATRSSSPSSRRGARWARTWASSTSTASGSTIPGLYVSGTGPAQVNPGTSMTYDLTYKNGSPSVACATAANCPNATDACVGRGLRGDGGRDRLHHPAGHHLPVVHAARRGDLRPPAAARTITCTFAGPVPAGAAGTFTVTVTVAAARPAPPRPLPDGRELRQRVLRRRADQLRRLRHRVDAGVAPARQQDHDHPRLHGRRPVPRRQLVRREPGRVHAHARQRQPVPSDPPHTGPTLNGDCIGARRHARLHERGLRHDRQQLRLRERRRALHRGQRRHGLPLRRVRPRRKCGYANGDGPCTVANGGTVCRSGACSTNGLCEPGRRLQRRRRLHGRQLVRRERAHLHAQAPQRAADPDRPAAHEPDARRHLHGRRRGRWSA